MHYVGLCKKVPGAFSKTLKKKFSSTRYRDFQLFDNWVLGT